MKFFLLGFAIIICFFANSQTQSPALSIILAIDTAKSHGSRYQIEMKFCEPIKKSKIGDRFSNDTSKINFTSLNSTEISCGNYFKKGTPSQLSGKKEENFNDFTFRGQVFAWEKILVFRISNMSNRGMVPDMYVVIPMKYKGFMTLITLSDLVFQSGKVLYLNDLNALQAGNTLIINQSLSDYEAIDTKSFPLKGILEKK